jgi:N-acetylglucosaminyldiphosphoundecaprenol N-acetyl-beta-D-mannosaminyltransferase
MTYILGTQISLCDKSGLLQIIHETLVNKRRLMILSGNVHSFNLAYENEWLRDFFNQADVVRLDGAGLRLGARLLGISTPPRMTWADFAWDLAKFCAEHQFSLFFLGGRPGVAEKAADKLRIPHPSLNIVGINHGYFDKMTDHLENETVIAQINAVRPDILIVGFGMPLQEKWLHENWERLNVKVALTGGAVFDYISGELQRGPKWMTDNGLEWLARLVLEPRRLWRRYIVGNPLFLWRVFKQRVGLWP